MSWFKLITEVKGRLKEGARGRQIGKGGHLGSAPQVLGGETGLPRGGRLAGPVGGICRATDPAPGDYCYPESHAPCSGPGSVLPTSPTYSLCVVLCYVSPATPERLQATGELKSSFFS